MNMADLDEETQARYRAVSDMRDGIVAAINARTPDKGSLLEYQITLFALVAALSDFIACAPEEKQADIYKNALAMLEQAYICNLTQGKL